MKTFFSTLIPLFFLSSCWIYNQQKYFDKAKEIAPFDAIIVPGVPFNGKMWSDTMKMRVYWAKCLYDNNITKNIIFSGGAVYTKYAECKVMKEYAIEMGIPEENIYLDSLAEHSTENVFYSTCVAQHYGFNKLALASDPYQTKMLKSFLKKIKRKKGIEISALPTVMDTIEKIAIKDYVIDADKAVGSNFINITETQGKIYRLKGTMGLHIDWSQCD